MAEALAPVFSRIDALKRQLYDMITNPRDYASMLGGRVMESAAQREAVQQQAFANPQNPLQITNPQALNQLTNMIMAGEMGFAPAGIVSPVIARQLKMPISLPADETFAKAVQNTPGAQVTEEGLLMRVQRSQKPEQAGEESVRTGVFYLPEGSASAKYYKQSKSGEPAIYGGSESIAGETLYKNPMFVKGATGGKAPEAAYDQLMGKGAYEKMRSDVLGSYSYNANQPQKIEAIQEVLQKYNGLDADDAYNMAYNIVTNSKAGNTLAYAVQENIVANAVRNAGYDAVLGYSKKKTGDPFLSEVFDVREATYPTKQGGFTLNPEFQSLLD